PRPLKDGYINWQAALVLPQADWVLETLSRKLARGLEHFQKYCSHSVCKEGGGGLFGFWLRFGSVTGFLKPAPSPKPRQNPKILAPNGYSIFSNALAENATCAAT